MRRTGLLLGLAMLLGCSAPAPTDIRFVIEAVSTCRGTGPEIRSVRVNVIGDRDGVECFEASQCVELPRPYPRTIDDVQPVLPASDLTFDVLASRQYQVEAIGFGTPDCTLSGAGGSYRFCGRSDLVTFAADGTVPIPALCRYPDVPNCAEFNAALRFCR